MNIPDKWIIEIIKDQILYIDALLSRNSDTIDACEEIDKLLDKLDLMLGLNKGEKK